MTPAKKGFIAAATFGLVHAGIIAAGASMIAAAPSTTSANPVAPVATPHLAAAKPAPAAPAVQAAPAPPPAQVPSAARALEERRFALTFLTDIANGKNEVAYDKLARETRNATTLKTFNKAFAPIADLGLQQVTWSRITERSGVTAYTPATGYTKTRAVTALEGTATSDRGLVRVFFTLVDSSDGWKVQHFRFKAEGQQKSVRR